MSAPIDRRQFLSGSAKAAAAAALVGGGGTLLAACGGSSGGGSKSTGGSTPANRAGGVSKATPKPGGTMKVGTTSEIDGFDPAANHWDATGLMYARTVYDPLAVILPDGSVAPYLAESITHNADYTEWKVKARSGVTFHDGEKLDGAAVVANLKRMKNSALAGPAMTPITKIEVDPSDPMTAVITMNESWVPFDYNLAGMIGGQIAYMVSPKAAQGGKVSTNPVGTGPFIFQEWTPGDHFTAKKNPNYWQQGQPYLDAIEYHPIPDSQQRSNSLKAGNIDVMQSGSAQNILDFQDNSKFDYLSTKEAPNLGEPSPVFMQINCLKDPLSDVRLRQALAYATDREKVVKVALQGVGDPSITGPFPKDSKFFADSGYPTKPDAAKAKELVDAWSKDNGGKKPSFKIGTVNDPADVQIVTLIQAMWQAVGFDCQIDQVEQAQYITNALTGNYDCYIWTQFGAADPDANYIWWSTQTVGKIGALSLNFAHYSDDKVQQALQDGRTSSDQQKRVAAYQSIAKQFGENVPYVWLQFPVAAIISSPKAQNWAKTTTPDGKDAANIFTTGMFPQKFWLAT